jgi:hypothetical protein
VDKSTDAMVVRIVLVLFIAWLLLHMFGIIPVPT